MSYTTRIVQNICLLISFDRLSIITLGHIQSHIFLSVLDRSESTLDDIYAAANQIGAAFSEFLGTSPSIGKCLGSG